MSVQRGCSKTGCGRPAVATLTYVYADRNVVLGPLATYAEPHTYDLCRHHAERLTPPRGWDIVRIAADYPDPVEEPDDLLALAHAVSEQRERSGSTRPMPPSAAPSGRRGRAVEDSGRRLEQTPGAPPAEATDAPGTGSPSGEAASGVVESRRRGHLRVLRDA